MRYFMMLSVILVAYLVFLPSTNAISQQKIVEIVNSASKSTWTASFNFNGADPSTLNHLLGVVHAPENLRSHDGYIPEIVSDLPVNFDAREHWPDCPTIRDIRDQSNCGSCWAFGAVEAMSDRICIYSNSTINDVRLSAQELMTCCRGVLKLAFGCHGGDPQFAWRYYKYHGIVTGWLYNTTTTCQPYEFPPCAHHINSTTLPQCGDSIRKTPQCIKQCIPQYDSSFDGDKHFGKHHHVITSGNCEHIQSEIFNNGPVEAEFTVYEDFYSYRSGVYQHVTGAAQGGHAIKMLGWGVENGVPYWLCANSWNRQWGDNGYFKILRGVDECGIEDEINCGVPKLD